MNKQTRVILEIQDVPEIEVNVCSDPATPYTDIWLDDHRINLTNRAAKELSAILSKELETWSCTQ